MLIFGPFYIDVYTTLAAWASSRRSLRPALEVGDCSDVVQNALLAYDHNYHNTIMSICQ